MLQNSPLGWRCKGQRLSAAAIFKPRCWLELLVLNVSKQWRHNSNPFSWLVALKCLWSFPVHFLKGRNVAVFSFLSFYFNLDSLTPSVVWSLVVYLNFFFSIAINHLNAHLSIFVYNSSYYHISLCFPNIFLS